MVGGEKCAVPKAMHTAQPEFHPLMVNCKPLRACHRRLILLLSVAPYDIERCRSFFHVAPDLQPDNDKPVSAHGW